MTKPRTSLRLPVALLVAAGALLAPAPATAARTGADPTLPGSHAVTAIEYDAGPTVFVGGAEVWLDELRGAVFVPSGSGPFPVLLLLHGKDRNCEDTSPAPPALDPDKPVKVVCPFGERFPVHRGFDYLATNLASHGYLVVSLLTNTAAITPSGGGITQHSPARAELLARTLDLLAEWNVRPGPGDVGPALIGRVDLTRIGAMGHSRGGEGVSLLIEHSQTRLGPHYRLSGVIAVAPTEEVPRSPHGVPYAVVVPPCDGDVSGLDGAYLYDHGRFVDPAEPAPRMMYVVRGANHNYFNSLWQSSDDGWGFAGCDRIDFPPYSPNRLAAADQQAIGLAMIAAFLRRYVGGETAFEPLVTGAAELPDGVCPRGEAPCPEAVVVSYLAPAADRAMVLTGGTLAATDLGGPIGSAGFTDARVCEPTPRGGGFVTYDDVAHVGDDILGTVGLPQPGDTVSPPRASPCPTEPTRSAASQVTLRWDGAAGLALGLSASPSGTFDATRFATLTFRTGVNVPVHGTDRPDVDVVLRDATGKTATVAAADFTTALRPPDGTIEKRLLLNGVRLPLSAFHGVQLDRLTAVELRFGRTGPGSIQLAELAFQAG